MKSTKVASSGWSRHALLELRNRVGEFQVGAVQDAVGILEIADLSGVNPRRFSPSELIECGTAGVADGHHVRRHVARDSGVVADEGMRADLVNWWVPE